jgi:alkanesulfonate monooxygenase SsuD/methylene tetrahydromethanopterin reductase-like flavin-dependent oxidoreductase (luciferase family)
MRLGMSLPHQQPDGRAVPATALMARARLLEDLGFDGIWFGDSIGRGPRPRLDPLMALAVAAAATTHVELGSAILQAPLRSPVELAQRLLTLHGLSGGRFAAGLGAGSTRDDFAAVGVEYERRFALFAQGLEVMERLFAGEQVGAANLRPWPDTVGGPPILIGSWHSGRWVERAARDYDGWIASGLTSFTAIREGLARYRAAGGRRALVGTLSVDLRQPTRKLADDEPFHLRCDLQEAGARLQRIAELGYDDALITALNHTEADITAADLEHLRALVPRDGNPPPRSVRAPVGGSGSSGS